MGPSVELQATVASQREVGGYTSVAARAPLSMQGAARGSWLRRPAWLAVAAGCCQSEWGPAAAVAAALPPQHLARMPGPLLSLASSKLRGGRQQGLCWRRAAAEPVLAHRTASRARGRPACAGTCWRRRSRALPLLAAAATAAVQGCCCCCCGGLLLLLLVGYVYLPWSCCGCSSRQCRGRAGRPAQPASSAPGLDLRALQAVGVGVPEGRSEAREGTTRLQLYH